MGTWISVDDEPSATEEETMTTDETEFACELAAALLEGMVEEEATTEEEAEALMLGVPVT
jgi:ADP-ribosylglycohydrolase